MVWGTSGGVSFVCWAIALTVERVVISASAVPMIRTGEEVRRQDEFGFKDVSPMRLTGFAS